MVEYIEDEGKVLAIIVKANYNKEGIEFFTSNDFSQQLGYMNRPKGYEILPHTHNIVERKITLTQEVLLIKNGKVRVDFYTDKKDYIESRVISTGDVILLAGGGHGFKMLEKSEIIEIKQGPFSEGKDKIRFDSVTENKLKLK